MEKIILVKSCSECPYTKVHWSKPDGLIYEGRSCTHKHMEEAYSSTHGMSGINPKCPLDDVQ